MKSYKKKPIILFFITGPIPSEKEIAEADEIKGQVRFRNARLAGDPSDALEPSDYVAGAIPERYLKSGAKRYPSEQVPKPQEPVVSEEAAPDVNTGTATLQASEPVKNTSLPQPFTASPVKA